MNFYKSLVVAGGVTGTILGAVLLTGLMTDPHMELDDAANSRPQTLRIQAVPVRLGGYGLKYKKGAGDIVLLSITVKVGGVPERDLVCRLAPRLVSTVTQEVTLRYSETEALDADIGTSLPAHLRRRFNQALKSDVIQDVTIDRINSGEFPPQGTCG
ncbi:MAG: hypothetical protein RIE87_11610 [Rhodospirillales bacterium]